jgi:esterase
MKLAYREMGQGDPVLLLHGLLGAGNNFGVLARALSPYYRVICPDLRNHGDSPQASAMSYVDMAEDVLALLDTLNFTRVALLGHSMGGKAAMVMARLNPDRVARLLVADIAPVSYALRNHDILAAMAALNLADLTSRTEADRHMQQTVADSAVRAFVLTNLVRTENEGWRWRVNLPVLQRALPEICAFPELDMPAYETLTYFAYGTRSNYVLPEHKEMIFRQFPGAQFVPIEAGHWLHAEQPHAFLQAVTAWLTA